MENKIDIAAILKDCPRGMELDCAIYDGVVLDSVVFESEYHYDGKNNYPIKITTKNGFSTRLTKYGQNVDIEEAKCVIFPKGKKTWEGFQRPFKSMDIVCYMDTIAIFKEWGDETLFRTYVATYLCCDSFIDVNIPFYGKSVRKEIRLATEKEKEKLFQAIESNGYKWNEKTKTLEAIKPTFKAGNKIKHKENTEWVCTIERVDEDRYYVDGHPTRFTILFDEQNEYELVPNKFDVNTLKMFDQVLVRLSNSCVWMPKFFSHYDTGPKVKYYPFVTIDNIGYPQCIPYNGNEHLSRTTNNCDEFYRVWEK